MMLKLAVVLGLLPLAAAAQTCTNQIFNDATYSVCEVDASQDLRLFLYDGQGAVLGTFGRIDAELAAEGKQLVFAMNAGMYHRDRRPVGLYVENGEQVTPIITAGSAGNFGMRPNGVFCIGPDGDFSIVESRAHAATPPNCRHATQSGPLLVIDGAYHPRFIADSPSRLIRNGVGVSRDGQRAFFVMSSNRVNFLEFATFFREGLGLRQALYLDGNISRLYAPELGRNDFGFPMGPVVGLAAPRP
jgi:uncharacterized protein YigE (DUF2233 family)